MSVDTILATLDEQDAKQKEESLQRFNSLVVQIADGITPDPGVCHIVISEADKGMDDLQGAATRLVERREMRAKIDLLPELNKEREQNNRIIAQAKGAIAAAQKDPFIGKVSFGISKRKQFIGADFVGK